jgi:hypothetical protein
MSEKSTAQRRWEIVKRFGEYGKADVSRNSIKEHNPDWEVKVKLMADGQFTVRVRKPPTNPKTIKKNKKHPKKKIK